MSFEEKKNKKSIYVLTRKHLAAAVGGDARFKNYGAGGKTQGNKKNCDWGMLKEQRIILRA